MNKKYILIFILLFSTVLVVKTADASLDVSVDNYYPNPVEAGDYFTVWLKVTNREETTTSYSIKFKPSYPFSLDPGEESTITGEVGPKGSVTERFKIRVDKGAKEGDNDVVFEYGGCKGCVLEEKSMLITVVEFQTMFDVVVQEINTEGVFIAIANIGKNPANAITVSIPEQEYFKTDLISSSIVGNLESGDYTIAAFKILPLKKEIKEKQELNVQIDYTDPFGVRRTVIRKVLLNPSSLSSLNTDELAASKTKQSSTIITNIWFWVSLVLAILLLRKPIKKFYGKLKGSKKS